MILSSRRAFFADVAGLIAAPAVANVLPLPLRRTLYVTCRTHSFKNYGLPDQDEYGFNENTFLLNLPESDVPLITRAFQDVFFEYDFVAAGIIENKHPAWSCNLYERKI
jgi:hypothetical protein